MAKLLNLDELAPAEKDVKLNSATFKVKEMTVEDFVKRQQEAKEVDNVSNDPAEQIKRAVKMVSESIPGIDEETVNALTMPQLTALINFIVTPPEDLTDNGQIINKADASANNTASSGNA